MIYAVAIILILALFVVAAWLLRRRSPAMLWRGREYRTVLDSLEDAILVYNKEGRPIYLNRAAREWFGLDEAESYETRPLRIQVAPVDQFLALLSDGGRASLKIGSRQVEAVSQRIRVQGTEQTTLVLHDVTAAHELLVKERRRVGELAVFNEINQAINASLDISELLNTILHKLQRLFPYTNAAISLWLPETEKLLVEGWVGPASTDERRMPLHEAFAERLVQERQPLLIRDTRQDARPAGEPAIRSYMGVPLATGSKLIGILELSSHKTAAFSDENLETLGVLASQVAVAIENARLYNETLARADELGTMNTLSSALITSLNMDELLEIVVYSVGQATACDRAAVFLMDSERGLLNMAKGQGLSEEFVQQHQNISPQLGGLGQAVLDRYPIVIPDVTRAEQPLEALSLVKQEGIRAYADLPLRGRETVLGVLSVYYDTAHVFEDSELELLRTFANQVTLALENARLYERTDRALARRVDQLAAIEDIGRELTSTLDLTGVFDLVLRRAMGSTGASAGLLALSNAGCGDLALIVDDGYPPGALDDLRRQGWPVDQGILGQVACTGEAALINDVQAEPRYVTLLEDTRAKLILPIKKEERVLGVISLESSRPQGFSGDDMRFTTQLAELAAIAIDNARLFQQVREGRDNLQAILDSTRDGVLVVGRDGRVVLANPMIEELSGLPAGELAGLRIEELVEARDPRIVRLLGYRLDELEEALELLNASSDQVHKRSYEITDPRSCHIEQVASPVVDRDGRVVGRLIVLRDVTEEHRLLSMRQDLTDMIIHDLRSPLTAVMGGVQVASDLVEVATDPDAIHHALDMAAESCNRLVSLVDSILDISRLEAGQMPLERNPVSLPALAHAIVDEMKALADRDMVTLQLQAISGVPLVYADDDLVRRVFVNLIDNALKHSPRNSTVTVKIVPESKDWQSHRFSFPAEQRTEEVVRCAVLDMGPGIPVELRDRVFERFAQLDGRRTGKGLGLAFCKLAVQAHGGRIWIEDNPRGKGSAFVFTLPAVKPELLPPAHT